MTILLALTLVLHHPDTLRLEECRRQALAADPRTTELTLRQQVTDLRADNVVAGRLPSLTLDGKATYQTPVAEIPLTLPGISLPQPPEDQYEVSLGVRQLVYDGGAITNRARLEHVQGALELQQVRVELYDVRSQVEAAYFGALAAQARAGLLDVLAEDIDARLRQMRSRVREGVALASAVDALEAERAQVAQQRSDAQAARATSLAVLSTLMGRSISDDVVLELPDVGPLETGDTSAAARPEFRAFELRRRGLEVQADLSGAATLPHVFGFAKLAYGRPAGADFFDDTFGPSFMGGIQLQWAFWDWGQAHRQREALDVERQAIDAQQQAFSRGIEVAVARSRGEIARIEHLIAQDAEIIRLRAQIARRSQSQLDNGVITPTDYLNDRTAQFQAELTRRIHEIQLARAREALRTTLATSR